MPSSLTGLSPRQPQLAASPCRSWPAGCERLLQRTARCMRINRPQGRSRILKQLAWPERSGREQRAQFNSPASKALELAPRLAGLGLSREALALIPRALGLRDQPVAAGIKGPRHCANQSRACGCARSEVSKSHHHAVSRIESSKRTVSPALIGAGNSSTTRGVRGMVALELAKNSGKSERPAGAGVRRTHRRQGQRTDLDLIAFPSGRLTQAVSGEPDGQAVFHQRGSPAGALL